MASPANTMAPRLLIILRVEFIQLPVKSGKIFPGNHYLTLLKSNIGTISYYLPPLLHTLLRGECRDHEEESY